MTARALDPTDPTLLSAEAVALDLGVDPGIGLPDDVAAQRLAQDGPNELRSTPAVPLWRKVLRQFQDPLVYLLLVAIGISLIAWVGEGAESLPVDAIVIALIVVANAVLGLVQEAKAESAVAALASMTAATSTVLRAGRLVTLPAAELVRGDVLSLSEGDSVGADARLLSATALRLEEASLTGESTTTAKSPEPLPGPVGLGDRRNMVHRGTAVVQGVGRAVVTATGMDTEMGQIAELLDRTEQEPSPLRREIASVSKVLGLLVIGIAAVVMAAIALLNGVRNLTDAVTILLMGVSLAVAAVPEGLPAILSLVLALGVRAMARRNAVMKDLHSVETLGSASVICSDKTGTLTRNEMTLSRIITPSGRVELTGTGYRPDGEARYEPTDGTPADLAREARSVVVAGALANNAQLLEEDGEWTIQGDPTEAAFLVAIRKLEDAERLVSRYERTAEVPFTSQRKMMSILGHHLDDDEHRLFVKGAPDVLLDHCDAVRVGERVVPLDEEQRTGFLRAVEELSASAYRTLGVAYRDVGPDGPAELDESAESHLVLLGVVGIIDPPRDEARQAVAQAHRAGIRTVMITGDHPATAARIAADLGISRSGEQVLSGADIDALDDEDFRRAVLRTAVYARVAPEHKLRIIDALQSHGLVVAMTGDGVNDAPALKSADIGIAMGITGTEVTKESSRMILGDDNYATIVDAVRQGRVIFDNIRKFLRYLLSSNLGEVATVFFGVVLAGVIGLSEADTSGAIVLPLLATQILWINLVTDSGPALAMGIDPEIDDVMARPPRQQTDRILDRAMWRRIAFIGLVMAVVTLLTIDLMLPGGLVEGAESLETARTAGFTTLVLAQLFNALNSRSDESSAFRHLTDNRWLWAAITLALALQVAVVTVPLLQTAFGTETLGLGQWLVCLAMASVVLWLEELSKLVRRRRRRHRSDRA
ncbi:cation-translocating P-type ATPase [Intrasporangium calvum]|uniref:Cation-translocating P-type ATPase n=1 Tax=Intrasporangium calvum TaxID=53358 RepID=A0ABT5GM76_9MICO|nr:cation-translocating P-type ATPase [Intrasporangium calvum]MDC5698965.1 cation-translocating P-type ATPase [Intrasporangium calvum]